jgi:hypothetical protein
MSMSLVEDIMLASLKSQRLIKEAEIGATNSGNDNETLARRAALEEIKRQIFEIKEKHNL